MIGGNGPLTDGKDRKMTKTKFIAAIVATAAVVGGGAVMAKPGFGGKAGFGRGVTFADIDANGDGAITQDELKGLRDARFAAADANGDGQLSLEELTATARERAQTHASRMLSRLDANKDGALSLDEMPKPRRAGKMFDRIDANGDGAISQDEFDSARLKHQARHGGKSRPGGAETGADTDTN